MEFLLVCARSARLRGDAGRNPFGGPEGGAARFGDAEEAAHGLAVGGKIVEFFQQDAACDCLRYKNGVSLLPLTVTNNPGRKSRNPAMQELVHNGYTDKFDAPRRLSKQEIVTAVAAHTNGRILPGKRFDPCIVETADGKRIECLCMACALNV
jgi:hypothetical protein